MLTTAQKTILKAAIAADPVLSQYPNNSDGAFDLSRKLDEVASPEFVVWKSSETVAAVGRVVNYIAFEALTTANLEKINTFTRLNMSAFPPSKVDVRTFWANVFSGALGGQGQATRDALEALWRRPATRAEKIFAVGTGTTLAPATLVIEGTIAPNDIFDARSL